MMFRRLLHPIEDAYISQFYANSNFGAVPFLYTVGQDNTIPILKQNTHLI